MSYLVDGKPFEPTEKNPTPPKNAIKVPGWYHELKLSESKTKKKKS